MAPYVRSQRPERAGAPGIFPSVYTRVTIEVLCPPRFIVNRAPVAEPRVETFPLLVREVAPRSRLTSSGVGRRGVAVVPRKEVGGRARCSRRKSEGENFGIHSRRHGYSRRNSSDR